MPLRAEVNPSLSSNVLVESIGQYKSSVCKRRLAQREATPTAGKIWKSAFFQLHFECDPNLFAQATIDGLGSAAECLDIIFNDPRLTVEDGVALIHCEGRNPRLLTTDLDEHYEFDECGCWPEHADRKSLDDYLDAQLSIGVFVRMCGYKPEFRLAWFSVQECVTDALHETSTTLSGDMDRVVGGR